MLPGFTLRVEGRFRREAAWSLRQLAGEAQGRGILRLQREGGQRECAEARGRWLGCGHVAWVLEKDVSQDAFLF